VLIVWSPVCCTAQQGVPVGGLLRADGVGLDVSAAQSAGGWAWQLGSRKGIWQGCGIGFLQWWHGDLGSCGCVWMQGHSQVGAWSFGVPRLPASRQW
jgi:hypothetical protein